MCYIGAQVGNLVVDVGEEGGDCPPTSLNDGDQVVSIEFHGHRTTSLRRV